MNPEIMQLMELIRTGGGFCTACGELQENIPQDATRGSCPHCGDDAVYGAAIMAMMGMYYVEKHPLRAKLKRIFGRGLRGIAIAVRREGQ